MLQVQNTHADRLAYAIKLMGKEWLLFIVLPLVFGLISAFVILPLVLMLSYFLISSNSFFSNQILLRLLVVILFILPTTIISLISSQVFLFALKAIDRDEKPLIGKLFKESLRNLGRFFVVSIYTYIYTCVPVLLCGLGIIVVIIIMSYGRASQAGDVIVTLGSILMLVASFVSAFLVIKRIISTIFTQIVCITENISARASLTRSIELTKSNWKTTLIHICILAALGIALNIIAGEEGNIISILFGMLLSSVSVIATYLLYKSFTVQNKPTSTDHQINKQII